MIKPFRAVKGNFIIISNYEKWRACGPYLRGFYVYDATGVILLDFPAPQIKLVYHTGRAPQERHPYIQSDALDWINNELL